MKTSTKFLAIGGAMIAAVGVVGTVQAGDRDGDRGWRDHGPRHERGYGHGRHHGGHHGAGGHRFGHGGLDMGGPGHGMGGKMMMMRVFQLADTDGDKSVTQEDFDAFLQDRMEQYDANGDGELQLDEYKAFFAEMVEPMAVRTFQFLDPDGDAALTAEEFGEPLDGIVERMDHDDDGKLTLQDRGRFHRGGWRGDDERGRERWRDRTSNERPGMMQSTPDASDETDDEEETPSAQ